MSATLSSTGQHATNQTAGAGVPIIPLHKSVYVEAHTHEYLYVRVLTCVHVYICVRVVCVLCRVHLTLLCGRALRLCELSRGPCGFSYVTNPGIDALKGLMNALR